MRSMTSESRTMLIANGHRPTPASSPFCVSESPNSIPHASIENARRMKQNDVATSAAKHTAKVFLASADSGSTPVIVASVLISQPPKKYMQLELRPGGARLARLQHRLDESHDAGTDDGVGRDQRCFR